MQHIVVALILFLCSISSASAQSWHRTPNTTPLGAAQVRQLPVSMTVNWIAPEGWIAINSATWDVIWPRTADGAWYRPMSYTQAGIYRNPVFPYKYSCKLGDTRGFICRDLVRGIDRTITCPASITPGPMTMWRASYAGEWPEFDLFTADRGPFSSAWQKALPYQGRVLTAVDQRINCQYGPITAAGPGTASDIWVFRRY